MQLSITMQQGYLLNVDDMTMREVEDLKTKVRDNDITDIELSLLGAKTSSYEGSAEVINEIENDFDHDHAEG